ncbi:hypothetical protein [Umezawaea tangerina]|uniref:Uncharacterized protein n=1 Tax=Umezawaea tangerina TaxID=84725 RepID=A0A2T0SDX4_9PSEU|nr:hypothetical protein [Umezawaea tangerina]PRY31619.1 hypothetical protein CLV43_12225 [Umezawaea tangerina]
MRRGPRAAAVAGVLSGAPSTLHALATGGDVLAATRAAGTLLPGGRPGTARGAVAHVVLTAGWTAVLAAVHGRRPFGALGGAAAGLAIAVLDLEVVGRRYPAVRALPRWPQYADHLAFGALVGVLLRRGWSRSPRNERSGGCPLLSGRVCGLSLTAGQSS